MGNTLATRTTWSSSRQTAGAAWQPSASQGPWKFPWVHDPLKRGHLWTVSVYYKLHIMLCIDTELLISLEREIHDHIIYTLEIQVLSLVAQFRSTLCDPMECSPPGSSVHGILQASVLERVAISSSRGSSWLRDQNCASCIGRQVLYHWATWEARRNPQHEPELQADQLRAE